MSESSEDEVQRKHFVTDTIMSQLKEVVQSFARHSCDTKESGKYDFLVLCTNEKDAIRV